ncbi:response regulator [Telmatobacter bradus]|uniref:response regulator n=1 Tax=Telmatobacter bradus TaxID=474953 RepID=UPI003B436DCF
MAAILLVDDEPFQAIARKTLLEKRFADVRRVQGAAEALCLIEQPPFAGQLGLLISGHHMPGLSGPAFVAEVCARMPRLPVLVLGTLHESASDYRFDLVRFVPLSIANNEMVEMADRWMTLHNVGNTGNHSHL